MIVYGCVADNPQSKLFILPLYAPDWYDRGQISLSGYMLDHFSEGKTADYIGNSYGIALIPQVRFQVVCDVDEVTVRERLSARHVETPIKSG